MKFKFDSKLDFQLNAIESTISLFKSQKFSLQPFGLASHEGIIPNQLTLTEEQILSNLQNIQNGNGIKPSTKLQGLNFSIEMETGTGKTYVYLRTIFGLNRNYGFKKFIIVVPSVAIREGTLKALQMTHDHFNQLYENIPYSFFEYDAQRINLIRQFSRSDKIEIMVMTLDSFNKSTNVIFESLDKLSGLKPIELIKKTNPILILDEPQNMESEISKKAIASLNPLFTLRYSATHKNPYNLIYQLTPVAAYNENLVKKIEVLSVVKESDFNTAFIKCVDIKADSKSIKAKLSINKKLKSGVKIKEISIKTNDSLLEKSGLSDYKDFVVSEINAKDNFVKFTNGVSVKLGEERGSNRSELMRIQIRETIREHFRKYKILKKIGIKPISLFFIDRVDSYLAKDGLIRKYFTESFNELKMKNNDFKNISVDDVQAGYFSKMKTEKKMSEDKDAFDLIMKDKERLLSFNELVQFIFSHSALREGWDNPNVFNICTLNLTISDIKKRQEIGRGVRLPVNQDGIRVVDTDNNILTVIANENYAEYASKLQKEYINEYGPGAAPRISNARNRIELKLKDGLKTNPEFIELWKRISKKTKYSIKFNSDLFIKKCIEEINKKINVDSIKVRITKADIVLEKGMKVTPKLSVDASEKLQSQFQIPNMIDIIEEETKLTRPTIVKIITSIKNLNLVFNNPQEFFSQLIKIIKENLEDFLIKGIQYKENNDMYKMELFDDVSNAYIDKVEMVENSIYDGIIYDSQIEKKFAHEINNMRKLIKLQIKLPAWFKIKTPIGNYNPDWALVREDKEPSGKIRKNLYFVCETKGTKDETNLRQTERQKIECAREHFKSINVPYILAEKADDILSVK